MKFIALIILNILFFLQASAQRQPRQDSPRHTLEEVFRAARTKNFTPLAQLCDPEERNDGDTKRICSIASSTAKEKKEFVRFFKLAYSLKEDIIAENAATVTFKFGPKAQQSETMRLVKLQNKWYLSGF